MFPPKIFPPKNLDIETHREDGRVKTEAHTELCSHPLKMPGTIKSWKRQGRIFPWRLQRKYGPIASTTVNEYISVVLSHPVCKNFVTATVGN